MATRVETVNHVSQLWMDGNDQAASSVLAELELADLVLEERIVQHDLPLYREGTRTVVPDQRMVLAHFVAIHNRCEAIVKTVEDTDRVIRLIGFSADVETNRLLFRNLVGEMLSGCALVDTDGLTRKKAGEAEEVFCEEFAWQTHGKLDVVQGLVEDSAKTTGLWARLKDRRDIVKARSREMAPDAKVRKVLAFKRKGDL